MNTHGNNTFRRHLALLTDFYELTMMAGYWKDGKANQRACFEYFFRSLPPHTGFAVVAGLGDFLEYLENLVFSEDDLAYLRGLGIFDDGFLNYLRTLKLDITVRAMPEGSLAFPYEPIVQVEGSIAQAQLIETALLNFLNYQTLIASKAARVCLAANGDAVLEFGLRRAHGPDGGLSGSRAAYIGGCSLTSNVLAGKIYGIPVAGTQAHSWVMSYPDELTAFRAFARYYPDRCVLLVDTYDVLKSGVPNAIRVFKEMAERGQPVRAAIRLDSGDLAKLSKAAHAMLRQAGFEDPLIVASNDLNEDLIADLKRQGAKINAWGVGTQLITAYDAPALSGIYKLVAVEQDGAWRPCIKLSANVEKTTDPGIKSVYRYYDTNGTPVADVMYLHDEEPKPSGTIPVRLRTYPHRSTHVTAERAVPLLETVFCEGRRVGEAKDIHAIRAYAQAQISALPEEYKRLRNPHIYSVYLSPRLGDLKESLQNAAVG